MSDSKELNQTAPRFTGFHSVMSNKPRLHNKNSYNKNQKSLCCVTNKNTWVCL